jgi:chromosome segregation ATPase
MRNHRAGLTVLMLLACAAPYGAQAVDDPAAERAREMLRRTQEALRQTQSDNTELTRAKTEAEQKLQAATKQLDSAQSGSKAAQQSLRAQLQSVQGAQDDLAHKLSDVTERLTAANQKQAETAKQLAAGEAELAQLKQTLELSKTANAGYEDKNLKLYTYAQAVLERYRKKGVWSALSQKEPVLGLKEVDVENVVQEYQLKFASQKVKP